MECSAQDLVLQCEDCQEMSVCTCRICDGALCRRHFGSHMDVKHQFYEPKSDSSTCTKHSLTFKFYCRSCVRPVCSDCMRYEDHFDHALSDPTAMLEYYKESISMENEELNNIIKPFYNTILDFIDKRRSELAQTYANARKNLEEFGTKLHEQVDIAVMNYRQILAANEKEQLEHLRMYLNLFKQRTDKIDNILEENSKLLQRNDPFDVLTSFESTLTYFHTYPDLSGIEMPVFQPHLLDASTIMHLAGDIDYPTKTAVPLSLRCKHFQLSQSHLLKHPIVLQKSSDTNLNILDLSCLQSDGVLTVGKDKQFKQFRFKGGKFQLAQTNELDCRSQYVAISPKCSIYFSDTSKRSIKKYENLYCILVTTVLEFDDLEPRGVAFTPSGNNMLVCLYSKQRSVIARFIHDNKLVQEIEHNGDKPLYKEPCFVCCNRIGDVCVADHGLNAVIVVDQFGVFQFSYRGQIEKSFRPHSLATDHLCNIVITDSVNHEIHLLDKYGQFLGFLTTEPMIMRPGAVDIDIDGKLWMGHSTCGDLAMLRYLQ